MGDTGCRLDVVWLVSATPSSIQIKMVCRMPYSTLQHMPGGTTYLLYSSHVDWVNTLASYVLIMATVHKQQA